MTWINKSKGQKQITQIWKKSTTLFSLFSHDECTVQLNNSIMERKMLRGKFKWISKPNMWNSVRNARVNTLYHWKKWKNSSGILWINGKFGNWSYCHSNDPHSTNVYYSPLCFIIYNGALLYSICQRLNKNMPLINGQLCRIETIRFIHLIQTNWLKP